MTTPHDAPPPFHGEDLPPRPPEEAAFHVIPVPWEATVSYGGGARLGPAAILRASLQLEAYLDGGIPGEGGIYTAPPVDCRGQAPQVLQRIEQAVERSLALGKVPILLGGEHTVSVGGFRAVAARSRPVGVVQFDAHADLRDTYHNNKYSHACVMRRALDLGLPIFQIGVRSLSKEEADLRAARRLPFLDADALDAGGYPDPLLPEDFPEEIYITFDIDGLDPSVVPATGTPEPGGLDWRQAVEGLERALRGRRVVAADVVELAPQPGHHASDFTAAKLVYKLMGLVG